MATSAGLTAIETALRGVVPEKVISPADDSCAVDGVTPVLVVKPETVDQVASVLRAASAAGAAVIPLGARNHLSLGMPPSRYDIALDLSKLNQVLEYSPADLTVTVQAGVQLSDLQTALGANGQWLTLDPPGADGTIGGLLATNRSGPARIAHGTARDVVIGLQVVLADGTLVKSGGRVVKNVAGYDLAKLHIGALGTLGVIVEATFKVAPLPAETPFMSYSGELANIMSTTLQIRDLNLAVNGLTLRGWAESWRLDVRFAGGSAAVARSRREVEAVAVRHGLLRIDDDAEPQADLSGAAMVRATVPVSETRQVLERLAGAGAQVLAYPTAGSVRAAWATTPELADLQKLRDFCVQAGGALVLEAAPVELKRRFDVWGPAGGAFPLMQRLKQQFDAESILNPGRYAGGL